MPKGNEVMHPRRILAVLCAVTLAAGAMSSVTALTDLEQGGLVKGCGYTFYGDYEPKELKRLAQLPATVRARLEQHLRARLGDAVYSRLSLDGGQIVDKRKLYRVDPDAKEYKWTIPAYELHFMFTLTESPLTRYCAEMELDEEAAVIKEIELPNFSLHPDRAVILPLAAVLEAAAREGIPMDRAVLEAAYVPEFDWLEWIISYSTPVDSSGFTVTKLHVAAHDLGRVTWSEVVGDY